MSYSYLLSLTIVFSSFLLLQSCEQDDDFDLDDEIEILTEELDRPVFAENSNNPFDDQCHPFYTEGKLSPNLRLLNSKQLENAVKFLNPNYENYSDPLQSHQVSAQAVLTDSLILDSATTAKIFDLMEPISAFLVQTLTSGTSCNVSTISEEANCFIPKILQIFTGLTNLNAEDFEAQLRQSYQHYRPNSQTEVALQSTILEHLMSTDMLFINEVGSIRDSSDASYIFKGQQVARIMHWALAQKPPTAQWMDFFATQNWQNEELMTQKVQQLLNESNSDNGVLQFVQNYLFLDSETIQGLPQPDAGPMEELDQLLKIQIQDLITQADFSFDKLFIEPTNLMQNPSFLSRLTAKATKPSPVTRGHVIAMKLLCKEPPGVAVDFPIVDVSKLPDTLTPREILEQHHLSDGCQGCHQYMEPFGFPLDIFDIAGNRIHQWPNGKAIDTRVEINLPSLSINGRYGSLDAPTQAILDLTEAIVQSDEFDQCMNRALVSYMGGVDLTNNSQNLSEELSCTETHRADKNVHKTIAQFFLSKSFIIRYEK